jgi:CheY-specific phosphatase CheX
MNDSAERILYRRSALIFEQLGFLMPRPDHGRSSDTGCTSAIVPFKGSFSGCLVVSLSTEIARQLSCNMLGDEMASNEMLQQDSLQEIAHVICGNTLPEIFGIESVFHLDPPASYDMKNPAAAVNNFSQAARALISFDNGTAEVNLFVEGHAINAMPQ